jgi:hypothetical protein
MGCCSTYEGMKKPAPMEGRPGKSPRRKACVAQSTFERRCAFEDRIALTAAVKAVGEALGVVVSEALAHLRQRHRLVVGEIERDLGHRGGSMTSVFEPNRDDARIVLAFTGKKLTKITCSGFVGRTRRGALDLGADGLQFDNHVNQRAGRKQAVALL